MKIIAFIVFIASFALFVYMKFINFDDRDGSKLVKIENNPRELKKLREETIEFKKEINDVFSENKKGEK